MKKVCGFLVGFLGGWAFSGSALGAATTFSTAVKAPAVKSMVGSPVGIARAPVSSQARNTCEQYHQTQEYKTLVADIKTAEQEYKALEQKIKGLLAGHPCPDQEYKLQVGEALLARLKAGNAALNNILQKLTVQKVSAGVAARPMPAH